MYVGRALLTFVYLCVGHASFAFAQLVPQNLNVSGVLFEPSGAVVSQTGVNFRLEVWDKAATCILYSEIHLAQDLTTSKGGYSLELGKGSSATNYLESSTTLTSKIFQNTGAVAGGWANCASGTNLASGDERLIRIYYDLGSGYVAMSPDVPITASAYAMVAESVQGKSAADLIQVKDDATTDLNQTNVENVFSSTNYARLQQLLNPTASLSFGSQRLTNLANPTSAQDAATKNYADTKLGGQTIDLVDVAPGFGGGKVLTWDSAQNKWVAQAPTLAGTAGGDLTGTYPNPTIAAAAIGTSKMANDAVTSAKINSTGIATNRLLITDSTTGAAVTYATCANNEILRFVTGTGWQCTTVSTLAPVTSVAGRTGAVTLSATDVSGLGTAATRNIGTAMSDVPELLTGGKLGVATIPLFLGDVTGSVDANVVTRLQGRDVASTAPNANEVLRWNGSRWEPQALTDNGITALTGDISASGNGSVAATLTNGVVTTPKVFTNPGTNRLVATDGTSGATLVPFSCNLNEIMQWGASGWACVSTSTALGGSGVVNNGNSFGATMTIGTNDAQILLLETNNSPQVSVLANGNVGIGTTAPSRRLDVAGVIHAQPSTLPGSPTAGDLVIDAGAGNALKYHNGANWISVGSGTGDFMKDGSVAMTGALHAIGGSASSPGYSFSGNTNTGIFAPAVDTLSVGTSGLERLRVSSTGNVGIGTTNPAYALDIVGALQLTGQTITSSTIVGLGSAGSPSYTFAAATTSGFYAPASDQIGLVTAGTDRLRVLSNGLVGVGTTAPTRLLDVAGPVHVQPASLPGSPTAGDLAFDSGAGNILKYHDGSNWVSLTASSGGDFKADGSVPMTGAFLAIGGSAPAPGYSFSGDTNTGIFAPTADTIALSTGGAERLRVLSTGNMAIGNSSPGAKLHVSGNIYSDNVASNNFVLGSAGTKFGTLANVNSTTWGIGYGSAAGPLGTQVLTWTNTGNVGIGTTSPTQALDVNGTARASAFNLASAMQLYSTSGNTLFNETGGGSFSFSGGNIGLGTTSPSRLLDVAGVMHLAPSSLPGSPAAGDLAIDSGAANALKYHNGSSWVSVGSGNGDFMKDGSVAMTGNFHLNNNWLSGDGGNEGVFVDSSGSVGIGTSAPSQLLDVVGDSIPRIRVANTSSNGNTLLQNDNYGTGTPFVLLQSAKGTKASPTVSTAGTNLGVVSFQGYNGSAFAADSNGVGNAAMAAVTEGTFTGSSYPTQLVFLTTPASSTSSVRRMTIAAGGNVGIGTTTPQAGLDIATTGTSSAILLPRDTTANRPTGIEGMVRYNSSLTTAEIYSNGTWGPTVTTNGRVNLTNQSANIATTTILSPTADTYYWASCVAIVTTAATTSSTLPAVRFYWTDPDANITFSAVTFCNSNTGNYVGAQGGSIYPISVKAGTNVQYDTSGYTSVGATSMKYALKIRLNQMP